MGKSIPRRTLFLVGLLARSIVDAAAIYVDPKAPLSANAGPGSLSRPLHSLVAAAGRARPGDTCYLRGGTYRETLKPAVSGASANPIVYTAYPGEKPVLSGLDSVRRPWKVGRSGLYHVRLPAGTREVLQVFQDGSPLPENTWPTMRAGFSTERFHRVTRPTQIRSTRWCLGDPGIPMLGKDGYWQGASLWILFGVKTSAHILPIDEHRDGRICFEHFSENPAYFPDTAGDRSGYFAILKRPSDTALLEPGQWSFDPAARRLSVRFAKGDRPGRHRIEIRTRLLGLDLSAPSPLRHIEVHDLGFFAASLDFASAESSMVSGCEIRYVAPFFREPPPPNLILRSLNMAKLRWRGVNLGGSANRLRRCDIDGSWADGISISGTGNIAEGNRVVNTNWIAGDFAGISVWDSLHRVEHNSIGATARSGVILVDAAKCRIAYNRIEDFGALTDDFGGIYAAETDGKGTEIGDNRIGPAAAQAGKFPEAGPRFRAKMAGIYLDIVGADFTLRGNTIRLGQSGYSLRLNGPQRNILIQNNALLDAWGAIATIDCRGALRGIRLENNRMPGGFEPSDGGCGLEWTRDLDTSGNSEAAPEPSLWEEESKAGAGIPSD